MHRRPCSLLHRLQRRRLLLAPLLLSVSAIGKHEFIYHGFSGNNLTMDGDASVFDGLLRLTSGKAHETGHAFYPYPLNFTDAAAIVPNNNSSSPVPSFSTTFVFAINSAYPDGLASDGLAFVLSYTTELYTTGSAGQFLGLLNQWNNGNSSNRLLAIELDTIQNTEFGDIDGNHIGIDVNSLRSNASHTAGYYYSDDDGALFHNLSLTSGKPMQVWVDYDSKLTMLNVSIAPYNRSSIKPTKSLLSVTYHLSSLLHTTTVYAGFSSATGIAPSKHYILGWSFKLNGEATPLNYYALSLNPTIQGLAQQLPRRSHNHNTTPILCIVLLPAVAAAIVVSLLLVKVHMKKRSQARKN